MKHGKILVVDDNQGIRSALKILLPAHFAQVEIIASPKSLVSTMETFRPDVVLLDMNFYTDINTGNEGLYWTGELKKMWPDVQIVLFTAYADIALAVEGMKRGAFDFIVKPWDNDKLISTLKAAYDASPKGAKKSEPIKSSDMYWGDTPAMMQIKRTVEKIAPTDATVLITGENGTGKDVLAREIHARSSRKAMPMVCVDAGAITETLFESELFGHVKGAFTDAHADHVGKFDLLVCESLVCRAVAALGQVKSHDLTCPHHGCGHTADVVGHMIAVAGDVVAYEAGAQVLHGGSARDDMLVKLGRDHLGLYGIHDCLVHLHLVLVVVRKGAVAGVCLVGPGHVPEQLCLRTFCLDHACDGAQIRFIGVRKTGIVACLLH